MNLPYVYSTQTCNCRPRPVSYAQERERYLKPRYSIIESISMGKCPIKALSSSIYPSVIDSDRHPFDQIPKTAPSPLSLPCLCKRGLKRAAPRAHAHDLVARTGDTQYGNLGYRLGRDQVVTFSGCEKLVRYIVRPLS